jgi:pimeloyl-ACP methyl ester carboxylesterase
MLPIRHAIRDAYPDADIFTPKLPFAGFWGWLCTQDAADVVAKIIGQIDHLVEERAAAPGGAYESINFVGHSMGAVFARKLAIVAFGEQDRADCPTLYAPFEKAFEKYRQPRIWKDRIHRIVLFAGMNRGWTPSSAMDWLTSAWWKFGTSIGETVFRGVPIIFDIRQGAVFSVQTRLQWLALMHREQSEQRPKIIVTQLLGTVDDLVSPDDSVDYAVDIPSNDAGSGNERDRSYFYLELPNSGHKDAIQLRRPADLEADMKTEQFDTAIKPGQTASDFARVCAGQRYVVFRRALCDPPEKLAGYKGTVRREDMTDSLPDPPNWKVTDVVFVIHGIRDMGFWTQKVARAIKQEAAAVKAATAKQLEFRSVTTSYGYFAMAPFVLWWIRKQKAEWLMDQYAEARAHYPRADFSYVGHSNGTYLVARALRDYPAARFKRVALAGSVVRRDYNWHDRVKQGRVVDVLNYVATGDWVVAIFPKGMQPIRILDLGSAGHDGFNQASKHGPVHQVSYIAGSHGAGHQERHWADIARFIVSGTIPDKDAASQNTRIWLLGRVSTGLLALLVVAILMIGFLIAYPTILCRTTIPGLEWLVRMINWKDFMTCARPVPPELAAIRACATVFYFWLVYIVISRV